MKYKPILKIIGISAPTLYLVTAIMGLVLKLGYNQTKYAFSDLVADGAPNKILLNYLFSIYNIFTMIFAVGCFYLSCFTINQKIMIM